MPSGGKRPGAGRPPGAATRKTREIADRAASEGLTPLEVMLRAMRDHATAKRWDDAAKVAALAAPYVHPRLAAVDLKSEGTLTINDVSSEPLTQEQWVERYVSEH